MGDGRTRKRAEFGKLKLEVDVIEVIDEKAAEGGCWGLTGRTASSWERCQSLPKLVQLNSQLVDLSTKDLVLAIRRFGYLFQLLDFVFQVFQMPFLALSECSLRGPVLSLALLFNLSAPDRPSETGKDARETYITRFSGERLPAWLLGNFILALPPLRPGILFVVVIVGMAPLLR